MPPIDEGFMAANDSTMCIALGIAVLFVIAGVILAVLIDKIVKK